MAASLSAFREFRHLEERRVGAGLSILEYERWMRLKLELDSTRQQASDRRRCFRIPTHLRGSLIHERGEQGTVISNFSLGGAFIQTRAPLPIAVRLALSLEAPDGKTLKVQAVVVSNVLNTELDPGELGMGVRFVETDPGTDSQIAKIYESLGCEAARLSQPAASQANTRM